MREFLYVLTCLAIIALIYIGFLAHITVTGMIIENIVKPECLRNKP